MEEAVKQQLEALIQSIKESRVYQDYCEIKQEAEKDPAKMKDINRYRTSIYDIQHTYAGGDLYYHIDKVEHDSEAFRFDPVVDRFLAAELALCRLVQQVSLTVVDELDFDIEFVRDGGNGHR